MGGGLGDPHPNRGETEEGNDEEEKQRDENKSRISERVNVNINFGTTTALWSGSAKNQDVSTGPLARPFACSLAPLTCSLAPDCSLRSRPPLRSFPRSWDSE